jgi:hypothetical protein
LTIDEIRTGEIRSLSGFRLRVCGLSVWFVRGGHPGPRLAGA